jgi:multidrug efflux pump subunit AcrA (membrane-fusion protein)
VHSLQPVQVELPEKQDVSLLAMSFGFGAEHGAMRIINLTSPQLLLPALAVIVLAGLTPQSHGSEVDGFTEPYRDIDVAASEMGPLVAIEVREGDRVTA